MTTNMITVQHVGEKIQLSTVTQSGKWLACRYGGYTFSDAIKHYIKELEKKGEE